VTGKNLLQTLNLPEDLRRCSRQDFLQLADEIRAEIIDVVSKNGGHLSSNLGVVELSIAIHAALSSPTDKIIWDVGHQSYPHKLLTGRLKSFPTIRRKGGLSGFTKREESPHDPFGAGHAATSISAAMGMAKARDLNAESYAVMAVIGDASISSGEAFEALNNMNTVKGPFIIVLNDNEMSISRPVGGLSDHITAIRTNAVYRGVKKEIERLLLQIPKVGSPLVKSIDRLLLRTKHLLINYEKAGVIYEEFGIRYIGPIDATDIPHMIGAIRFAASAKSPVLIHVISKKGQGFKPAEDDPTTYHGLGKFDAVSGEIFLPAKLPSYTQVFGEAMLEMAALDSRVVAITAAMTDGTGLARFAQAYPERLIDVGISEEHALTYAAGLAAVGKVPVVAIYSTFVQRAFDQIIHDIALQNLPVIIALDRAGLVGEDGPTHHGVFDLNYCRMIPNLVVMAPKDGPELRAMLRLAIASGKPVAIRYPRDSVPMEGMQMDPIVFGKAEWLLQTKKAKTLVIAIGTKVASVYGLIKRDNLPVSLVNIRSLKPLDKALLLEASKGIQRIVTIEEGVKQGGLYSAICEWAQEESIHIPVKGLGLEYDRFYPQGNRLECLQSAGLDIETIKKSIE
jgi:1-deoxy-D-xylulose-5-phosphate synthase